MPRMLARKDPSAFKTLPLLVEASPDGLVYQALGLPLNFQQMLVRRRRMEVADPQRFVAELANLGVSVRLTLNWQGRDYWVLVRQRRLDRGAPISTCCRWTRGAPPATCSPCARASCALRPPAACGWPRALPYRTAGWCMRNASVSATGWHCGHPATATRPAVGATAPAPEPGGLCRPFYFNWLEDLPSRRRATMSSWICWVPSKMSRIFESRAHFSNSSSSA